MPGGARAWRYAVSELGPSDATVAARGWLHGGVTTTTPTPLTAADRCDRCGAQAYVRVVLSRGELLFCAHHARRHASAYSDVAVHVQDETERLHEEHGAPLK